jgi:rsbT co-antagonist protein RsbR
MIDMQNNKKLYLYLQDRAEWMIDRWTLSCGIETSSSFSIPSTLKEVKRLYQIFIIDISKIFLVEQGLFFSYLHDWMNEITKEAINRDMESSEIHKQFKKLRTILWECVGEFVELHSEKIGHKEILLWSELIDIAFDHIIEDFTIEYARIKERETLEKRERMDDVLPAIIPVFSEIGLLPVIGELNMERVRELTAYSINQCEEKKVWQLFIDLSGLRMNDPMSTVNGLLYMASSLQSKGLKVVLSGVRPDMVQKLVEYNLAFHHIETHLTFEKALKSQENSYFPFDAV